MAVIVINYYLCVGGHEKRVSYTYENDLKMSLLEEFLDAKWEEMNIRWRMKNPGKGDLFRLAVLRDELDEFVKRVHEVEKAKREDKEGWREKAVEIFPFLAKPHWTLDDSLSKELYLMEEFATTLLTHKSKLYTFSFVSKGTNQRPPQITKRFIGDDDDD